MEAFDLISLPDLSAANGWLTEAKAGDSRGGVQEGKDDAKYAKNCVGNVAWLKLVGEGEMLRISISSISESIILVENSYQGCRRAQAIVRSNIAKDPADRRSGVKSI